MSKTLDLTVAFPTTCVLDRDDKTPLTIVFYWTCTKALMTRLVYGATVSAGIRRTVFSSHALRKLFSSLRCRATREVLENNNKKLRPNFIRPPGVDSVANEARERDTASRFYRFHGDETMKIFRAYTLCVRNMHVFVKFAVKVFDLWTYIGKSPKTLSCLPRVRRLPPSFHIALYYSFFFISFNLFFCSGEKIQQGENKTLRPNVNNTRWHGRHRIALAMMSCSATVFLSKSSVAPRSMQFK